jgi:hypothetical protein
VLASIFGEPSCYGVLVRRYRCSVGLYGRDDPPTSLFGLEDMEGSPSQHP